MLSISNTVHIDAPHERVWRTMIDAEHWRSSRRSSSASLAASRDLSPWAAAPSSRRRASSARSGPSLNTEGRSFSWNANMLPGVHLSGGHVVEADDSGTRVTLSLQASGPMWLLIAPALARIFRRNVRLEGEGMKAYLEAKPS